MNWTTNHPWEVWEVSRDGERSFHSRYSNEDAARGTVYDLGQKFRHAEVVAPVKVVRPTAVPAHWAVRS